MTTSLKSLGGRWYVAVAAMFVASSVAATDLATRSGDLYVDVRIIQVNNDKVVGEYQGRLITLHLQELTESSRSALSAAVPITEKATKNSERSNEQKTAPTIEGLTLASPTTPIELPAVKMTSSFENSRRPLTLELAMKSVGDQIDARREAEKNASPLDPFWKARFWKFIPIAATGLQRGVDDPFFTPAYLTVPGRQIAGGDRSSRTRCRVIFIPPGLGSATRAARY